MVGEPSGSVLHMQDQVDFKPPDNNMYASSVFSEATFEHTSPAVIDTSSGSNCFLDL